jgi:hypothetical protein
MCFLWGMNWFYIYYLEEIQSLVSRVEARSNTTTVTLRVVGSDEKGSLEPEPVKYGHESHGTQTRKWLRSRGPHATVNDRPVLLSERAPHINKPTTVWLIKIWSQAPDGCFIPRQTGRLAVGRNIRLRLRIRLSLQRVKSCSHNQAPVWQNLARCDSCKCGQTELYSIST